jgi:hypothetical protein
LLLAKQNAQETFLRTVLKHEGNCSAEFYKYVKRRRGNRENIPAIKDVNGRLITDPTEKANFLNFYCSSIFSCERSTPQIQHRGTLEVSTKIIRKRLAEIGKNKSVGPDKISGEMLKLNGEAMIPY